MGAASIGLGMIGGPIGSLGQQILGGNLTGAISSGLGMINPVMAVTWCSQVDSNP